MTNHQRLKTIKDRLHQEPPKARAEKRTLLAAAIHVATPMVRDELVASGEAWLGQQWAEGVRNEGSVDEHHRLAFAGDFVLQGDAV